MHGAAHSGKDGVLKLLCDEGQTFAVVNNVSNNVIIHA